MTGSYLPVIAAAGILTYGTRIAGLVIDEQKITETFRRFLHFVPIGAFAALVAPGIAGFNVDAQPRLVAAAAAGIVVLRYNRLWACVAVGLSAYWLAHLLL
jgi:branched-subunit amino acid transport protein